MPKDLINPFKPNSPVATGTFAGRVDKIERMDQALDSTAYGNPVNMLITGERGIGKTSLLLAMQYMAKGMIRWSEKRYNFLVVHISIDGNTTFLDMGRRIKGGIEKELGDEDPLAANLKKIWDVVKRVELKGVGYKAEKECENPEEAIDVLAKMICDTASGVTKREGDNRKNGIVIMIDEADNASRDVNLGGTVKYISEYLVREGCNNVMFILAGLPKLRDVLRESHESSLRIFEEHELSTLSNEDATRVISLGLEEINKNYKGPAIEIDKQALDWIAFLSEGYPHFVQQVGASMIDTIKETSAEQNKIDGNLVTYSFTRPGGALDRLGDRYYRDMYVNKIKEEAYRNILRIMAKRQNAWVTKAEIKKEFKGKTSTLGNGIQALKERNIILSKPGSRGQYRLQWLGFAVWINRWEEYHSDTGATGVVKIGTNGEGQDR